MLLRMSTAFLRTLRDDPSDAEVPSHRLLVRAGYLRRAGSGAFSLLPLGKLVLDAIARIVREEMAAIGAQEVLLPALLPSQAYQASGRWVEYGAEMFRLRDRRGADHLLAPTHEEAFTLLVKDLYGSYRDFPVILYQVQTKFRDEPRPRGGLLRCREFLMKDSYSFDLDEAGLATSYAAHRGAYLRIFARLGLDVTAVTAMAGAMGGTVSEEFLAPTAVGEDTYVSCGACGYAANIEAVRTTPATRDAAAAAVPEPQSPVVLDTPDTPTIASLVARLNAVRAGDRGDWSAADTLKNVVVTVTGPDQDQDRGQDQDRDQDRNRDRRELLVVGVPGDRDVDLKRLNAALYPRTAELATSSDLAGRPELVPGYIGPRLISKIGLRYLVDPRIMPGSAWVTGANEPGRHAVGVVCGRDFVPDGTIEATEVRAGDPCPSCGSGLAIRRGVEVGHIFQLGRAYTDVFGLDVAGPSGRPVRVTMGSYGIGISRVMAAIVEQHHDHRGLSWPRTVAPCEVHVVPAGGEQQVGTAEVLARSLDAAGWRVLLDDRTGLSAGVKFTDSELIGVPYTVVVGRRTGPDHVELRRRDTGERTVVPLTGVADTLADLAREPGIPTGEYGQGTPSQTRFHVQPNTASSI